jgi:hypothetical protein
MIEFDIFKLYRGLRGEKLEWNPYEQGTTYFSTGQLGERIRLYLDGCADRTRVGAPVGRAGAYGSALGVAYYRTLASGT